MVFLFYTTYISVDLAHHEKFRAKVGKGDIKTPPPPVVILKLHYISLKVKYVIL